MVLECGFETVGNATLILHDGGPLFATDPWIGGSAYFGSWYFRRAPADYLRHRFETGFLMPLQQQTSSIVRSGLGANSTLFQGAKKAR
ncbi:MAG: hypothetical protein E6J86_01085 [Deltaproteobacteria bacterium]|nr:MAG: hypothetical protein E6J86_01085 [Deltaproteobacteria bacterium]